MKKWIAILIGVLVVVVPLMAEAKAKCPTKPKNAVRAKRLAKKFFNKGGRLAQKERYTAALDSFLCSLKMKPHENTVYNVAQVSKFVIDRDAVRKRLERFLKKHPKHASRDEVEELIASVEGTYQPPPEDGYPLPGPAPAAGESPEEVAEEATAEPADEVPTEDPDADFDEDLDDDVADLFVEETPEPPEEPVDESQATEENERAPPTKIAGYVLLGTAGATLITAIGLQAATGAAKNDALDAQDFSQFTSREDKMSRLQTGATVFWIATGVLAGAGVVLVLLDTDEQDDGAGGVEVEVGAAPAGLLLQGRF